MLFSSMHWNEASASKNFTISLIKTRNVGKLSCGTLATVLKLKSVRTNPRILLLRLLWHETLLFLDAPTAAFHWQ
jgi:ABC-type molybdenum transport system ATPase subunit/photorepair protein PhrA